MIVLTEEDYKSYKKEFSNRRWMSSLKNHRLMKMTTNDWLIFINFVSDMLYMFVAFMCGLIIGYIIGFRNGGM